MGYRLILVLTQHPPGACWCSAEIEMESLRFLASTEEAALASQTFPMWKQRHFFSKVAFV